MTLLAPLGLLALLALPLIIILHMLRERRRRVVVPSLLLWQRVPRRDEAQRRRRLPLSLLLLLHLLTAALLGLALAGPQVALPNFASVSHTAVVIDLSTSMAASAPAGGTRLEAAQNEVRRLLASLDAAGSLTIIAAGPTAYLLDRGGPEEVARLDAAMATLRPGGTGSDLAGALTLAEAALQGLPATQIVVLTDAALPAPQLAALSERPSQHPIRWASVGGPQDNRALVALAARPRSASGPVQVYARAVNYGGTPLRTTLRLYGDERLLDTRPLTLAPGGESEITWTVPRDLTVLRAELDGGDGLPADDLALVVLNPVRPVETLIVSANPDPLERALRAVPGLRLRTIAPGFYLGSAEAQQADLTIFERYVPPELPGGGVLLINPLPGSPLLDLGAFPREPLGEQAVLRIAPAGAALLDGLSLASVSFGPVYDLEAPAWANPLLWRGSQPLILRGSLATSEVAIWNFELAQGNLISRLVFPLLTARTVRALTPPALPAAVLVGDTPQIQPDPRANRLELGRPDGRVTVVPITPGEPLRLNLDAPGLYQLTEYGAGRILFRGQLAVNAGSPAESDLTPRDLPAASAAPSIVRENANEAQPLWPWLAALALGVIMIEWFYVHGRRHAVT
ncbi:MAG: vWA domain-containing protein [Oscillochloridaceae bacterium umkhey_bin13]